MRAHLGRGLLLLAGAGRPREVAGVRARASRRAPAAGSPPPSPRTPPTRSSDADLAATAELAREHGLPVHIHASENRDQAETSLARHGVTPDRGPAADRDPRHRRPHRARHRHPRPRPARARERATGRVAVATAPRGYLKFAWPTTTPVRALREIGIDVGLATDGAASNNSLDVWESMALTALIQKSTTGDPRWLTSRQALHHATLQSARAVGLGELDRQPRARPARRHHPGRPHRPAHPARPRPRRHPRAQRPLLGRPHDDRRRPRPHARPRAADDRRARPSSRRWGSGCRPSSTAATASGSRTTTSRPAERRNRSSRRRPSHARDVLKAERRRCWTLPGTLSTDRAALRVPVRVAGAAPRRPLRGTHGMDGALVLVVRQRFPP